MYGGGIFKIHFDGVKFDLSSAVNLTPSGGNFFPTWSPDGRKLAFDSNLDSPTGLKFIWTMNNDGTNKKRIAYTPDLGETRMAVWVNDNNIYHIRYVSIGTREGFKMDSAGGNVVRLTDDNVDQDYPQPSYDLKSVYFIQVNKGTQLYQLKENTFNQIVLEAQEFSLCSNGEIVYLKFDYSRIDDKRGCLWIINPETALERQLTYNHLPNN